MAGVIYFDITDLLIYARHNDHVSGIQRTALMTMRKIRQLARTDDIEFFGFHPTLNSIVGIEAKWVVDQAEFETAAFKEYLLLRDCFSLRVFSKPISSLAYFMRYFRTRVSLFLHRRSQKAGVRSKAASSQAPMFYIPRIMPHDKIVVLGAFWEVGPMIEYLRDMKDRGAVVHLLVHDTIPIVANEHVPEGVTEVFREHLKKFLDLSATFFANSEATARDLKAAINQIAPARVPAITVIPLACEFPLAPQNGTKTIRNHIIRASLRPYVLCVGTIESRKNQWGMANVWRKIESRLNLTVPRLIFAGKRSWLRDELEDLLRATGNVFGNVLVIDDASDAELQYLYQNCLFTVYPSFYEGWGLPVGESLWFGKTCITSSVSSLPEVGQDLCFYVDPYDLNDIYEKTLDLIEHPAKRLRMEKRIKSRRLRTWDDVARDYHAALKEDG